MKFTGVPFKSKAIEEDTDQCSTRSWLDCRRRVRPVVAYKATYQQTYPYSSMQASAESRLYKWLPKCFCNPILLPTHRPQPGPNIPKPVFPRLGKTGKQLPQNIHHGKATWIFYNPRIEPCTTNKSTNALFQKGGGASVPTIVDTKLLPGSGCDMILQSPEGLDNHYEGVGSLSNYGGGA